MAVAQFLEIQGKMFPRHLRFNITKTKIIVSAPCMGSVLIIHPSPSPSKPWILLVPRSQQFCFRNVSLHFLFLSLKCCSKSV